MSLIVVTNSFLEDCFAFSPLRCAADAKSSHQKSAHDIPNPRLPLTITEHVFNLAWLHLSVYLHPVVLNTVLAALAFLSLVLLLWQWFVAVRFPLHQRIALSSFSPA